MTLLHRVSIVENDCVEEAASQLSEAAGVPPAALVDALGPLVEVSPSWAAGKVRVQAGRKVGTLRIGQLRVDVKPRMAAAELATLIRIALGGRPQAVRRSIIDLNRNGMDELICSIFGAELAVVRQAGLSRQYVGRTAALPVLRGRPDFVASFPWNDRGTTSVACRFHELTYDNLDNRLVRAALEQTAMLDVQVQTRRQLLEHRGLWSSLASLMAPGPTDFDAVRARYNRLTDHYRLAHSLSEVILRGLRPSGIFDLGPVTTAGLVLDMAALFERFLEHILALVGSTLGLEMRPQQADRRALVDGEGAVYRAIRPDVVAYRGELPVAVIDAKYKDYWRGSGYEREPQQRIANDDLYQLFFYSQRLQLKHALARPPKAIIICPLPSDDERDRTPMLADRYQRVMCRSGHDAPSEVHLVLLPLTDILRDITRAGRLRLEDHTQSLAALRAPLNLG
ncbi:MAG: McrC family protein [Thermoanaerobaculaceae bacterium]|nr:McrC family protein [Thermoanaerobaculaceae bacterium]